MDNTKVKRLDSSPEILASRVKHILHSKIFIEAEVSALFELLMEKGMLSLWCCSARSIWGWDSVGLKTPTRWMLFACLQP